MLLNEYDISTWSDILNIKYFLKAVKKIFNFQNKFASMKAL